MLLLVFFIHYYAIHSTIFYILLCYVMEDKITTQMKKGVLEYIILAIIAKWEVYASDIITTLKEHNLLLVEGTLYPLLSRLKTEELLSYSRVESPQWPPRKLSSKSERRMSTWNYEEYSERTCRHSKKCRSLSIYFYFLKKDWWKPINYFDMFSKWKIVLILF